MTTRKITALVIIGALIAALSATTAFAADLKTKLTLTLSGGSAVSNPTYDETYTLSVPESLRITTTGWNAMDSMTVKYSGSSTGFDPAKKLVVTATSANSFKLTASGISDTISYFLATGQNDTSGTTSFTFTAAQITASASQTLGVNVEDFSSKSNGTYTDEITYTVAIEDAGTTTTTTVTWNADDITSQGSDTSFSRDGVIITAGNVDFLNKNFNDGTFTTTLGNFTKIEVSASGNPSGTGWSGGTWTGTASNSVAFSGSIRGISTIVFTIDTSAQ